MKLRDVSGIERELADLTARHDKLKNDADALRTLIEALPAPVWIRDTLGRLVYANPAYARAVEAESTRRPRSPTASSCSTARNATS